MKIRGAIVICNHWTQFGIGKTFPEGEIGGRWYRDNFSTVFCFECGRKYLAENPRNRVCHEFDAYFLEALTEEDPAYLKVIQTMLDSGKMELPGGTYGQAESQIFGYESAIRQLTFGQKAYAKYLGHLCTTYLVEEQSFFTQLPQLLVKAGFTYASIQFQNSGTPPHSPYDLIRLESPDGSTLPTVPPHPGLLGCWRQWASYKNVAKQLAGRPSPLIFQWIEIWPPGQVFGASIIPYQSAIRELERRGYRQMTLSEYIRWALKRTNPPRVRYRMDQSNYNNNFFEGGWGYENEKITRASNQCESLLLAAEALCADGGRNGARKALRLSDLWKRLLVAQNHDPYLAGHIRAYLDGLRTYGSELAMKQFSEIRNALQKEFGFGAPLSNRGGHVRIFNPCPWDVQTPVLIEVDTTVYPDNTLTLSDECRNLQAIFRSDNGNVLFGPALLHLPTYGTLDANVKFSPCSSGKKSVDNKAPCYLKSNHDNHIWRLTMQEFADIEFEPLTGEWRQVPLLFNDTPKTNVEAAYPCLEKAPVMVTWKGASCGMDVRRWTMDLMRIGGVPEPALSVQGLVFAGFVEEIVFVEFNHRLAAHIRFATGKRPFGTWRFRIRVPSAGLRIFADSPFAEEERLAETFYCARYVRLEWSGRHVLWCPLQNTLFRKIVKGKSVFIECTVFDFDFMGTANWGMRFYATQKISPAHSVRLAETYHRRPFVVSNGLSTRNLRGITSDNPDVVITHVFPAADKGNGIAVRVLNASDQTQQSVFNWSMRFSKVSTADLNGRCRKKIETAGRSAWKHTFRPWEIETFCVTL